MSAAIPEILADPVGVIVDLVTGVEVGMDRRDAEVVVVRVAGDPSPWLFPGGQPGRPISATHLGQRLKDLGIQPGPARSTALLQLATELPAALLARMLGIHIGVAVAWQRASAGDWTSYAADVSRRSRTAETRHDLPRSFIAEQQGDPSDED